jgi:gluconolactonase
MVQPRQAPSQLQFDVVATGLQFPEGPCMLGQDSMLVVELARGTLTHVDLKSGECEVVAHLGGSPNGVAIGPDHAAYVCNNGGISYRKVAGQHLPVGTSPEYKGGSIQRVDLNTGESSVLYESCESDRLVGPNDIVFDASGGFFFTDKGKTRRRDRDLGGLYYALPDGSSIVPARVPVDDPNGVGLSPEGDLLYAADTSSGRLWSWPISAPGTLGSITTDSPIDRFSHGAELVYANGVLRFFDSLAVEENGFIVVASIGSPGGLTVVDPATKSAEFFELPDPFVTNICFGGHDRKTAYVTLGSTGRLLRIKWPRPGLALND